MTISTSSFFDRSRDQLLSLSSRVDTLQTQISTGKKINSASDDAAGYQQVAALNRQKANNTADNANLTIAKNLLDQTDSTLGSITAQIQRAQELGVQANSGTLSDNDRAAIAESINGIIDDVLALANSKDARGQSLFGGTANAAAFTKNADGTISYTGGGAAAPIPIGDGRSVAATESGDAVFTGANGGQDVFAALNSLVSAVKSGNATDMSAATDLIGKSLDGLAAVRGSVGARAYRVDLDIQQITDQGVSIESQRSSIEDLDVTAAITELQKQMTILQASQASFSKLSQLSVFDHF